MFVQEFKAASRSAAAEKSLAATANHDCHCVAGELAPDPSVPPNSNKLVIGLNPPFGTNGSLASKFTLHAATFMPRLIVLIVPPQTVVSLTAMWPHHHDSHSSTARLTQACAHCPSSTEAYGRSIMHLDSLFRVLDGPQTAAPLNLQHRSSRVHPV